MKRSCDGYTLIEVLLVVGIVAILAGVGTLSLNGLRRATSLESEIKSISGFLRTAQERSINQEELSRWGVYLTNPTGEGNDTYSLYKVDEDLFADEEYTDIPGTITDTRGVRGGIMFDVPEEATSTNFVFNKLSGTPTEAGMIRLLFVSGETASGAGVIRVSRNGTIAYPGDILGD